MVNSKEGLKRDYKYPNSYPSDVPPKLADTSDHGRKFPTYAFGWRLNEEKDIPAIYVAADKWIPERERDLSEVFFNKFFLKKWKTEWGSVHADDPNKPDIEYGDDAMIVCLMKNDKPENFELARNQAMIDAGKRALGLENLPDLAEPQWWRVYGWAYRFD